MESHARNFGIVAATTAIAIWLSTVESIAALVSVPVIIAMGPQIATGKVWLKCGYWAASLLALTIWLLVKEAYSPIAPPGVLALIGFWSVISALTFAVSTGIGYASARKNLS